MKTSRYSVKFQSLIGFMLAFFAVGSSLVTRTIPSTVRNGIILLLFTSGLFYIVKTPIKKAVAQYIILILLMMIFIVVNSGWGGGKTLLFFSCLLLCLVSSHSCGWHQTAFRVMVIGYMFYALATVFLYFNRSVYLDHVVSLFPQTKARLINWYNSGYMAGLTEHYSTNAMLLVVGLMLSGTFLLTKIQNREITRKGRKQRWFYAILTILFTVSLLLTAKRAHILFAIAAFFVVYFYSVSDKKISNRFIKTISFVLTFLVIVTIVISVVPAFSGFIARFQQTMDNGDVSMGRFRMWGYALDTFRRNWLLGIGWHQFASKVSLAYDGTGMYDVHNIYLQLLCETGVLGFSVYIIWMISCLKNAIKNYKKAVIVVNSTVYDKCLLAFSLGFQVFFLLYGFTGNPLYDEEMFIPYFMCCAITIYYLHKRYQEPAPYKI